MPATMKAAVVRAFGQPLTIEEVPVPLPGPGQIQVKIAASGAAIPIFTPRWGTGRSSRSCRSFPVTRASDTSPPWARA